LLSLPPGTKMVHFPGFASRSLLYSETDIPTLLGISLQDSDIPGSQPVCGSPRLIAAYHVLPRLPSPRHPPYALSSLTIKFAPLEISSNIPSKSLSYGPSRLSTFFYPSSSGCQRSCRLIAGDQELISVALGFRQRLEEPRANNT
jgi:hypothetical protein